MKAVVFNGTGCKGITHYQKQKLLEALQPSEVREFYPEQMPPFCTGCKTCFFHSEMQCPHREQAQTMWEAVLEADILVFAYPTYALRVPASVKSLLDHWAVHWMVHRPEPAVFSKRAVIVTNASGPVTGAAKRDVCTSLHWLGVSDVRVIELATWGAMQPDQLPASVLQRFQRQIRCAAAHVQRPAKTAMSVGVRFRFGMCRLLHRNILKGEPTPSPDSRHWLDHGWIRK